jgi:hypothetical protein
VLSGIYNGDLGLVERVTGNKVWVRLIPRLEKPSAINFGKNNAQ